MNTYLKHFGFIIKNRFVIFGFFIIVLVLVQFIFFRTFLPTTENEDLWFYSGIVMVLFSILFIEPYYTSPKNVITNTLPLLLVFLAIKTTFINISLWWLAIIVLGLLLFASILALSIEDKNNSPDHWKNKASTILKNIVVILGQGKVLYSAVFLYFLLTYHSIQNTHVVILFVVWFFVLSINPKKVHNDFISPDIKEKNNQVGEIFGVQSKKTFLVKLFDDKKNISNFDMVKFRYSMQDPTDMTITGVVLDTYLLNKEKWAKVQQLSTPQKDKQMLDKNIVYKITDLAEITKACIELKVDNLVGAVIDGSTIGKIRFEYSKKNDDLQEGDLLEVMIPGHRLFYQVIGGLTQKEKLEASNETGYIVGEAIQLGEWDRINCFFLKFGWVPSINTSVFKTNASDIQVDEFMYPNYKLGRIPGTELPLIIDLDQAISHHMAILGVTGAGKSFIAREIIKQIMVDTKIICIDFNKEFVTTLNPPPQNIISEAGAMEISKKIDWINDELEKWPREQDKPQILVKQREIKKILKDQIDIFFTNPNEHIKIFELPDVSNTLGILDYTKYFFRVLFEIAKDRKIADNPMKICVVLEEAHTIIPEWTFLGVSDKTSQNLVNNIGQIALQGRKYGIGFLVIAQRTANVSKTVLTQCNTVICFQAFDETSFIFLGNYVGKEMIQVLPNLKQYHAVVAGKAIKSNLPMIIDLTR